MLAPDACDAAGLNVRPVRPDLANRLSANSGRRPLRQSGGNADRPDERRGDRARRCSGRSTNASLSPTSCSTSTFKAFIPMEKLRRTLEQRAVDLADRLSSLRRTCQIRGELGSAQCDLRRRRVIERMRPHRPRGGVATFFSFQAAAAAIAPRRFMGGGMTNPPLCFSAEPRSSGSAIRRFSSNSGVSTLTLALRAIMAAMRDAGLSPDLIDGVATHGSAIRFPPPSWPRLWACRPSLLCRSVRRRRRFALGGRSRPPWRSPPAWPLCRLLSRDQFTVGIPDGRNRTPAGRHGGDAISGALRLLAPPQQYAMVARPTC